MEPIRVVLVDMAPMTREIVRCALERASDVVLAAELPCEAPLESAVDEQGAEVVIFGTPSSGLPDRCLELMRNRPRTRVLTVNHEGRASFMYELRPHAVPLGEASAAALLEAIRRAVRPR